MTETPTLKTRLQALHSHLGSDEEIVRILGLFYARMAADPMLGFFFMGRELGPIVQKQAEFLLRAMGRRPSYAGRPPAQAHGALAPILPGHFDRRLVILREVLSEQRVHSEAAAAWIEFEASFRTAVLARP